MLISYLPVYAVADGFFSLSGAGSPLFLILAIACILYGVWMIYRDRKKPKSQREQEYKRQNDRFIENINRNEETLHGDDFPIPKSVKAQMKTGTKTKKK